jgi:hypothetical protein
VTGRATVLALAAGLALFPSLAYVVVFSDGSTEFFGAPLPWNSRSLATSLAKDVYLVPLVIDASFHLFVSHRVVRAMRQSTTVFANRILAAVVWAWGIAAASWMLLVVSIDPVFHAWYPYAWVAITHVWLSTSV